jgi:hypothetical protein
MTLSDSIELTENNPDVQIVPVHREQVHNEKNQNHNEPVKLLLAHQASTVTLPTLDDYLQYNRLLYTTAWLDAPNVSLAYKNLSYRVKIPDNHIENPSVAKAVKNMFRAKQESDFNIYNNLSGVIPSGRMTLILGAPGCGKSQFLKTLGGHMRHNKNITGTLLYDGLSADEQLSAGIYTEKLCALVAQGDVHMANLTVRETLNFAFQNSVVDLKPELFNAKELDSKLLHFHKKKVELLLSVLGMHECANTIAGNAMIRG